MTGLVFNKSELRQYLAHLTVRQIRDLRLPRMRIRGEVMWHKKEVDEWIRKTGKDGSTRSSRP